MSKKNKNTNPNAETSNNKKGKPSAQNLAEPVEVPSPQKERHYEKPTMLRDSDYRS